MNPAEAPMATPNRADGSAAGLAGQVAPSSAETEPSAEADQPVSGASPPSGESSSQAPDAGVRRLGIKLALAAAAASFFGALYLEHGNGLFLAGASTALALIAYWLAEYELGRGGR
jgi:hypothetical protein